MKTNSKTLLECAKWHAQRAKFHTDEYNRVAGFDPQSIANEHKECEAMALHERFAAACREAAK